ncbi:hypothetical protein [Falsibacillus albus]|uniref:hypothetical protein n=1 Tax=Falsibacillus albus TaxID=2478915 RepID=UPI001314805A|nr:hypothetical protein [Falsibacillus albus]
MVNWWITTIMLAILLGCIGGFFIHFLRRTLNPADAERIDPNPEDAQQEDTET